jgi:predicted dehydrogenase
MAQHLCRWGILGTANIAHKNWKAIRNSGNSTLVAVASRNRDRARQFIEECQVEVPLTPPPVPCGSYEELLRRNDVDAVYIPLPTGIRKEWVIRAAEAKKHVLCEKPCGVTSADVRAMLDACRRNDVQFMDGVMFMHSRRLPLLRQVLDDRELIGKVRRIASQFSFTASEDFLARNIRVSGDLEPLGCLGDLGWYNIRFSLWVCHEQLPQQVTGRLLGQYGRPPAADDLPDLELTAATGRAGSGGRRSSGGGDPVPIEFSGELFFAGGVSASFYCSFRTANQQWANVSGMEGYVQVEDFVVPFYGCEAAFEVNKAVLRIQGCDFNLEKHPRRFAVQEYSNSTANSQETNMIRTFAHIVVSGQLDPRWGELALKTQQVVDACLRSAREDGKLVAVS